MSKNVKPEDFEKEISKLMDEYLNEFYYVRQEALEKGTEIYLNAVKTMAPKETGNYADNFIMRKFPDRKFVGNTTVVTQKDSSAQMPLSNILEYGGNPKRHRPHLRPAFENSQDQIFNAIVNTLKKGGS